jgi:signal transduction histidine kinase
LYIEFNSRYTPEEIGYPELLLDRKVRTNTDLSRYSYARYNTNKLVSHFGQFPYRLVDTDFNRLSNDSFLINRYDGYSHLAMRSGKDTLVVLSLPIPGMMQILTPFSYLTLLFTLLLCVGFIAGQRLDLSRMSFKRKIQSSIIAILFISLLLIGGGTILYIISNNTQKNQRNISEKIHSILVETELMLNRQEFLDPAKSDEIAYGLSRQANVFFSDINLFSPSGILFASSRTKLFDEGLISRKINPEAFYHLSVENTSEYIHSERIGQLEYISAYVPMRNAENKVIGYLNLPYFARQSELQREIASFVVAIVNIYVLLAVLVIIAAIFLSNSVTGPLRILQDRLASVKLGSKNEAIQWKSRDEIGTLIDEYNGMLAELAASAEKLAKSERESAWREMAKQVAHEIKNPLTPMKLNTQMLKRAWEDKAPGFEERLNRYAQNLIEQIDTLSHIATEFGNFAQMPRMQKEEVDMRSLLQHVAEFHENQHCSIHFTNDGSKSYVVLTDKEQMLRAFNNLIRNAEQAIPDDRKGEIGLRLKRANDRVVIQVSDNGKGIPSELQERIFRPNFTTKTTGMGLGLALVKNIVESSDGQIHFETEVDRGTTFTLELPAV